MRVFFWLIPDHPVFHQPNQIETQLGNAPRMWSGDIGDLIRINPDTNSQAANAQLLAGTNPAWKMDHATLVSCVDGRVIIQTFGSHEYQTQEMISLWQNYIYQTLKYHFEALCENVVQRR